MAARKKSRTPAPKKRVLLVVLGFIPGTLKHQNIVKTSSSSSPFTVATYLKPHYLHQNPKQNQQNPPNPTSTINSYSTQLPSFLSPAWRNLSAKVCPIFKAFASPLMASKATLSCSVEFFSGDGDVEVVK